MLWVYSHGRMESSILTFYLSIYLSIYIYIYPSLDSVLASWPSPHVKLSTLCTILWRMVFVDNNFIACSSTKITAPLVPKVKGPGDTRHFQDYEEIKLKIRADNVHVSEFEDFWGSGYFFCYAVTHNCVRALAFWICFSSSLSLFFLTHLFTFRLLPKYYILSSLMLCCLFSI